MNNTSIAFTDFLEEYLNNFILEYGRRKLESVHKKVQISKKVSELLYLANEKNLIPNGDNFVACLMSMPYFMIAKPDTIAIGAILSLERWNEEKNKRAYLADDDTLVMIGMNIITRCNRMKFRR